MKKSKTKRRKAKDVSYQDTQFYFDDCPICRAMKGAEDEGRNLSENELLDAFEKAKDAGGVVIKNNPQDIQAPPPYKN